MRFTIFRTSNVDSASSSQSKSENNEISTKSVDLRGLMSAIDTMQIGLNPFDAIMMGIANKSFDEFERQIVIDTINTKIPANIEESIFND